MKTIQYNDNEDTGKVVEIFDENSVTHVSIDNKKEGYLMVPGNKEEDYLVVPISQVRASHIWLIDIIKRN